MKTRSLILVALLLLLSAGIAAQEGEQPATLDESAAEDAGREGRSVRRLGDMVGAGESEFSMDFPTIEAPAVPVAPQPEVSLPNPEQDAQLQNLLTRRAFVPEDPDIQAELSELLDDVAAEAGAALQAGDLGMAQRLSVVIAAFQPNRAIIGQVAAEANRRSGLGEALSAADAALDAGNLAGVNGNSAAELYREALALDPGNAAAAAGLDSTFAALLDRSLEQARELDFEAAEATLERASGVRDDADAIAQVRADIVEFRQSYMEDLDDQVMSAISAGDFDRAESLITRLLALDYPRQRVEAMRVSLTDARLYGSLEPGQRFSDTVELLGEPGPELVVIPAGAFMMGSPEDESGRFSNEGPRHRVTFERGFALSQTEVSVAQFTAFVNATGYRSDAEIEGQSRVYEPRNGRMDVRIRINWRHNYTGEDADPNLPVIHVSWNDAQAYVTWLSEQTGRSYRLPSEAEFEYALRAGSQTPYWWGQDSPEDDTENLTGDGDISPTNARWNVAFRRYTDGFWGPAPVASLQANPFGLHDMGGNVMEWMADCWHDSFVRAPDDGSAWVNPGCDRRVIKGGAWSSTPPMARSAFRLSSSAPSTDMRVGFRVARDL